MGSGIKCGVNVWRALRTQKSPHEAWLHRLSPEEAEVRGQDGAGGAGRGGAGQGGAAGSGSVQDGAGRGGDGAGLGEAG